MSLSTPFQTQLPIAGHSRGGPAAHDHNLDVRQTAPIPSWSQIERVVASLMGIWMLKTRT